MKKVLQSRDLLGYPFQGVKPFSDKTALVILSQVVSGTAPSQAEQYLHILYNAGPILE